MERTGIYTKMSAKEQQPFSNTLASGATGTTAFTAYALVAGPKADNATLQDLGTTGNANEMLVSGGAGVLPTWQIPGLVSGATGTISYNAYSLILGPKTGGTSLQDMGGTGTLNQILTSQGSGTPPMWQTGAILSGATGTTVYTPYAVVLGPKADNNALQDVGALGNSGQVLTSNGAGTIPTWQTPSSGSSVWVLKSYSTTTASSVTVSSLNLSTDNKHYHVIVEMDNDATDERVNPYIQINGSTTADTYGTVWSGRLMDWSAGTASDSNGVYKGSQWKLGGSSCYSQYYVIDFYLAESEASAARVTGTFHSNGNGNDTGQEDFTSYVGSMFNNDQTNITSIKFFHDGVENKDWRVWILYPSIT